MPDHTYNFWRAAFTCVGRCVCLKQLLENTSVRAYDGVIARIEAAKRLIARMIVPVEACQASYLNLYYGARAVSRGSRHTYGAAGSTRGGANRDRHVHRLVPGALRTLQDPQGAVREVYPSPRRPGGVKVAEPWDGDRVPPILFLSRDFGEDPSETV